MIKMSVPPPYTPQRNNAEQPMEDCRDYLRTGRCKYGASCKYYHPPNVQSGGGMKTPIDPSEPMFPIRPNEPVCQYYMKHGTCKFGQACKFHHPPQPPLQPAVVANGRGTVLAAHQLLINSVGSGAGGGSMMLQFLPQRPGEPDCIYFLKNGRCKYGATCRYHHPINFLAQQQQQQQQQRRPEDPSRRNRVPSQDTYRVQNVQYIGQLVPTTSYVQGQGQLSDGSVTLVNFDPSSLSQGFQALPIVTSNDGTTSYAIPIANEGSSTSSINSYDTALDPSVHGMIRARPRNGSGGSLSAYANLDSASGQTRQLAVPVLHHSGSDGNIGRRNRSTSYGSGSEASSYYDSQMTSQSRNNSVESWQNDPRLVPPSHYGVRSDINGNVNDYPQAHQRSRLVAVSGVGPRARRNSRRGHGPGEGDDGFHLMTSTLLNMLDTTEEVGATFDEDDPRLMYAYPEAHHGEIDPAFFEKLSLRESGAEPNPHAAGRQGDPSWPPNSRGGHTSRTSNEAMQVLPHHHANAAHSHPGNDVGLYLP